MRARVSSQGQVTVPKEACERGGLGPGSEVEIEEVPGGVLLKLVHGAHGASVDDLLGCTGYRGPAKTLEDMEAAIQIGAAAGR